MGLPALVNELPADFRADLARLDLVVLQDQAEQKLAVLDRTTQAADTILHASMTAFPEYTERLAKLSPKPAEDAPTPIAPSQLIQRVVENTQEKREGVADVNVVRDVIKSLHTDVQTDDSRDAGSDDDLKRMTRARDQKNSAEVQLSYAARIAARHQHDASAHHLEDARYKALVATRAVTSQFGKIGDVETWEADQLARLPFRARVHLVSNLMDVIMPMIGSVRGRGFTVSDAVFAVLDPGMQTLERARDAAREDDYPLEKLEQFDQADFDEAMLHVIEMLEEKAKPTQGLSLEQITIRSIKFEPRALAYHLGKVLEKLDTRLPSERVGQLIGRIALGTTLKQKSLTPKLSLGDKDPYLNENSLRNFKQTYSRHEDKNSDYNY